MKKTARILSLLLGIVLMSQVVIAASFKDIEGHWAQSYIEGFQSTGIVKGNELGEFKPNDTMTKVQYYAVINRMFGLTKVSEINIIDVQKGSWYYDEVAKGIAAGYITHDIGYFEPNEVITKDEVVRILGVVSNLRQDTIPAMGFTDYASILYEAKGYAGTLKQAKVITGNLEGAFQPKKAATRAEIVTILYRFQQNVLLSKAGEFIAGPSSKIVTRPSVEEGPEEVNKFQLIRAIDRVNMYIKRYERDVIKTVKALGSEVKNGKTIELYEINIDKIGDELFDKLNYLYEEAMDINYDLTATDDEVNEVISDLNKALEKAKGYLAEKKIEETPRYWEDKENAREK